MIKKVKRGASVVEDGESLTTPVGRLIAAMDSNGVARLGKATIDDSFAFSDNLTHMLLANMAITLEKMNYHLQSINNDDFISDEDIV
jgi:hypothetical protein